MRINIYAEEITDKVEIVTKTTKDGTFTGLRFYLELPVTDKAEGFEPIQRSGPFMHHEGDNDSAAVTFWGKRDLIHTLEKALLLLHQHYARERIEPGDVGATAEPRDGSSRQQESRISRDARGNLHHSQSDE